VTESSPARLDRPAGAGQNPTTNFVRRDARMNKATTVLVLSGAALFSLGLATGLTAQTLTDSPQRIEQKRTDLTGAPNMEVIASIVELKPGESSHLHVHHGIEAFHVLQGALVQAPGQEPTMLATGLTSLNLRDVKHGAFTVVGPTPLKLLTVHIVDKDRPLYDFVN
jgi:quercetin dioxygenase-like cupin family protein